MISEVDVTLTDWALAVEAGIFAALAGRDAPAWTAFFASIATAAFLGGVTHGFFSSGAGWAAVMLWRTTLLVLGATSVAAIVAGTQALAPRFVPCARRVALAVVVVYALVVLFLTDAFAIAILAYVPATLFLLGAFAVVYVRTGRAGTLAGVAGLGVLLLGSWVQWRGIATLGLSHNALYHVIEAAALPLIYCGAHAVRARAR